MAGLTMAASAEDGAAPGAIDIDGHVVEPDGFLDSYLPAELHALAPCWVQDNQGRNRRLISGQLLPHVPFSGYLAPRAGASDPVARLSDMDDAGITHAAIVPSVGLFFSLIDDPANRRLLCGTYNTWLHDWCSTDSSRLLPVGVMPQGDPVGMIAELEHCAADLGTRVIVMRTSSYGGMEQDHPGLDRFWAAAAEAGVAVLFHGATEGDPKGNYLYRHALDHPQAMQQSMMELMLGGVFDRHPTLRVAFCEAGSGWVPYWLERLTIHRDYWGHASRKVERSPAEYFSSNCLVTPITTERALARIADELGIGGLAFSSDYPLPYDQGGGASGLWARQDVDEEFKIAILSGNAREFLRIAP